MGMGLFLSTLHLNACRSKVRKVKKSFVCNVCDLACIKCWKQSKMVEIPSEAGQISCECDAKIKVKSHGNIFTMHVYPFLHSLSFRKKSIQSHFSFLASRGTY